MAATFTCRFEVSTVATTAAAFERISKAVEKATPAVVVKAAKVIQTQAKSNASHRPGPKVITGALRNSILVMGGPGPQSGPPNVALPVAQYRWSSIIAPTIIYGRIQELGGNVYPHHMARSGSGRPGMLRWFSGGSPIFAHHVYLPPRPYLAPSVVSKRGAVQQSFYDSWALAIAKAVRL
jgi:hypothetical protein